MNVNHFKWLPAVDEDLCTGCAACVEACGPKSLEIRNGVAELAHPDTCGSEEHCIAPCPTAAIQMRWVPATGNLARGKWREEVTPSTLGVGIQPPFEKETIP